MIVIALGYLLIRRLGCPQTWEFFRNTMLSGGLFTGLFVGSMKLNEAVLEEPEAEPVGEEAVPAEQS